MASAVEIYRATRKDPDLPWNTYVCRPIAAVVVAAVAPTPITPNQITLIALVVAGASAALLAALPGYAGALAAVLLFELSYVLDCADGMLARHRGGGSIQGHLLDFLMDEIKAFMVLAAVAVHLWSAHGSDDRFLLIGLGGLVALATGIALTTFQRRPEVAAPTRRRSSAGSSPSLLSRGVGLAEGIAKQVIHYPSYLLFVALYGDLRIYLYPYVVVNALYALRAMSQVALRFGRSR